MSAPGEHERVAERLEPIEVACWRNILVAHADDLVIGICSVCLTTRCFAWRAARDRLASAGELMSPQERWRDVARVDRKTQA